MSFLRPEPNRGGQEVGIILLLSYEEHSFLKRVLARIWQCVAGAEGAINGGLGEEELWVEIAITASCLS